MKDNKNTYVRVLDGPFEGKIDDPDITFPFECDDFQKHSFRSISNEENVLVTAHTGCGKTAVAKYAIAHCIRKNKIAVYTSPIKALSNQKYKEFREAFENNFSKEINREISIGLMTGDNKINPNADCVIMTTEILRNALYDIGEKGKTMKDEYFEDNFIDKIGCVIFDEVHYINDKDRGHVWEETIVLLKPNITLVLLSATIDKSYKFAEWIGNNKKRIINLIPTNFRVVPLEHFVYADSKLYKIMDKDDKFYDENYDKGLSFYNNFNNSNNLSNAYLINDLVKYLKEKNLLQTIFFSFSRKNCEKYAKAIQTTLLTPKEINDTEAIFNKYMHKYEKSYNHINQMITVRELLLKGVSFHHSGLLPILKEIVEILFQRGFVKVLFATETFAVGVNMPARTIVFTELEKFTNDRRRLLHTAEYKQMSGRAGRRGLDKFGSVIIIPLYETIEKKHLKNIMFGKVPHIQSKFSVDYSFVLKILQSNSSNLDSFMNNSLYQQDANDELLSHKKDLEELENKMNLIPKVNISKKALKPILDYIKICDKEKYFGNNSYQLNNAQLKQKLKLRQKIFKNKNMKKKFNAYFKIHELESQINNKKMDIENIKTFTSQQVNKLINVLNALEYLKDNKVNMKSIIAAQINECNPIILTEMITQRLLDDLCAEEICAMLAIFIDDNKSNNEQTLSDIKCSNIVKNRLIKLNDIITNIINIEKEYNIDNYEINYWNIHYNYVDIAYNWASGKSINEIMSLIDTYEGNFIRNMLKINNIANDVSSLTQIYGNLKIIPELDKIDSLLVRDIVTASSLYLS